MCCIGIVFAVIATPTLRARGQSPAWRLVWSDEFDGPVGAPPSTANWRYQAGPGAQVGGNEEAEFYCAPNSAEPCNPDQLNAYLDGSGHLVIAAVRTGATITAGLNKATVPVYTSARLVSRHTFQYGRVEASIRLPAAAKGVWPAFWSMGQEVNGAHWPAVGEIDIMEQWNPQPGTPEKIDAATIHGAVHGPVSVGSTQGYIDQSADYVVTGPPATGFHQYAIEWTEGEVDFYVDGNLYYQTSPAALTGSEVWAQDQGTFPLLLNLAMGGGFFGYPDASTADIAVMVVNYVRVYQRFPSALPSNWSNADIGGPAIAGGSTFRDGVLQVSGSGAGVSGRSDQFQFAYTPMSGDGEVSAHLLDQTSQGPQAKAAVMLREGRGAAAPYVMLFRSPDGSVHFRFRSSRGEVPGEVPAKGVGGWLKIGRQGDVFTGFVSADGKKWTPVGDARLAVQSNLLAGLVATSSDNRAPNVARFDYLEVTRSDAAFDGEAARLPGVIQAERFNTGGPGYSYSPEFGDKGPVIDTMPAAVVQSTGAGGRFVRALAAGRYLNYTVSVAKDGDYVVLLRAASDGKGGTLHLNLDQKPLSSPFAIPDTGGLTNWREIPAPSVHLRAGQHTLALVTDSSATSDSVGIDAIVLRLK